FWFSPGTAVKRFNDAEATSRGAYGFVFTYPISGGTSAEVIDALGTMLFVASLSPETRGAAIGFLDVLPEPVAINRIRQAAAVLRSDREFLTHWARGKGDGVRAQAVPPVDRRRDDGLPAAPVDALRAGGRYGSRPGDDLPAGGGRRPQHCDPDGRPLLLLE